MPDPNQQGWQQEMAGAINAAHHAEDRMIPPEGLKKIQTASNGNKRTLYGQVVAGDTSQAQFADFGAFGTICSMKYSPSAVQKQGWLCNKMVRTGADIVVTHPVAFVALRIANVSTRKGSPSTPLSALMPSSSTWA